MPRVKRTNKKTGVTSVLLFTDKLWRRILRKPKVFGIGGMYKYELVADEAVTHPQGERIPAVEQYGDAEYRADLLLAKEKTARGETKDAIELYLRASKFKQTPYVLGRIKKLKNENPAGI